jgi:hypothetical protein
MQTSSHTVKPMPQSGTVQKITSKAPTPLKPETGISEMAEASVTPAVVKPVGQVAKKDELRELISRLDAELAYNTITYTGRYITFDPDDHVIASESPSQIVPVGSGNSWMTHGTHQPSTVVGLTDDNIPATHKPTGIKNGTVPVSVTPADLVPPLPPYQPQNNNPNSIQNISNTPVDSLTTPDSTGTVSTGVQTSATHSVQKPTLTRQELRRTRTHLNRNEWPNNVPSAITRGFVIFLRWLLT